jgi:hypothetical protein
MRAGIDKLEIVDKMTVTHFTPIRRHDGPIDEIRFMGTLHGLMGIAQENVHLTIRGWRNDAGETGITIMHQYTWEEDGQEVGTEFDVPMRVSHAEAFIELLQAAVRTARGHERTLVHHGEDCQAEGTG